MRNRLWLLPALLAMVAPGQAAASPPTRPVQPHVAWHDVTEEAGIVFVHRRGASAAKYLPESMGSGVAILDYDGDGWMDLYFVQSGDLEDAEVDGSDRLYRNLGGGRFEDVTQRARIEASGYGQGVVAADYDGDGWTDLYLTNFGPNQLWRNRGDGTFEEVAATAGVADEAWGSSATFIDGEGDGDLDLYVVNYLDYTLETHIDCVDSVRDLVLYCHPDTYPAAADVYFRNRGDGTFEDATQESGLKGAMGKGLGVVTPDFDGDRARMYSHDFGFHTKIRKLDFHQPGQGFQGGLRY